MRSKTKNGEYVDHVNHNALNNRKYNLKITTNEINVKNRKGANKNTSTGYRNVSLIGATGMYRVQLQVNRKRVCFGDYSDVLKAASVAKEMREKYYKRSKTASKQYFINY
jgi:hypothetical protein